MSSIGGGWARTAAARTAAAGGALVDDDPVVAAARNWEAAGWLAGPRFTAAISILATTELIRASNEHALRPFGLTHSRHEALAVLHFADDGALPLGRLGRRLLVHPTSVTSTVDTLERLGLAERVPHPSDRRTTLARITPAGRAAMEQSSRMMADARFGLGALTDRQARDLHRVLTRVRAAAGDDRREEDDRGRSSTQDPLLVAVAAWERQGWEGGPLLLAAASILRVAELVQRSNQQALAPFRLTSSRHEALAVLHFTRSGELPLGKLGQRLLVHPTSVTSTIDTFERLGLVQRVPHPTDRRAVLARITPRGRVAIETSSRTMGADAFGLGALSDAQATRVYRILKRVRIAAAAAGGDGS